MGLLSGVKHFNKDFFGLGKVRFFIGGGGGGGGGCAGVFLNYFAKNVVALPLPGMD